jgi:uncharacterized linocin/CFP29 family protein
MPRMAPGFAEASNPLSGNEWNQVLAVATRITNSSITRRVIRKTGPLGAGVQSAGYEIRPSITAIRGPRAAAGVASTPISEIAAPHRGFIIPIIFKDFVLHWRDLAEARLLNGIPPTAQVSAAAAACARREDTLVLFGDQACGCHGLMTSPGRQVIASARWERPGDAFGNIKAAIELLLGGGHNGPYAAIVSPDIFASMHRALNTSGSLEVANVKALLGGGVFWSSLLDAGFGVVLTPNPLHLQLVISLDTSVAFLGYKQMNPRFRVLESEYLRIIRPDALCVFEP